MFVLGHLGITLGTATVVAGLRSCYQRSKKQEKSEPINPENARSQKKSPQSNVSWITHLGNIIDIRILFIGSILPDLIDKPVGRFFFRDTFSYGRIYCHTLLFLILLTIAAMCLYYFRGKIFLIPLSFGTGTHLLLDQMWFQPRSLLWPLLGLDFDRVEINGWITNAVYRLITSPSLFIPEMVGAIILITFTWALIRTKKIGTFVKWGRFA